MLEAAQILTDLGFDLVATRGSAAWLKSHGLACDTVNKVYEGRPDIVDMLKDNRIAMVLNTTEGAQAVEDSREIRSIALYDKIPAALAIRAAREGDIGVQSLQAVPPAA